MIIVGRVNNLLPIFMYLFYFIFSN